MSAPDEDLPPRVVKAFEDGHFYSAVPDLHEVLARRDRIFAVPDALPGIDLAHERQLELVPELARAASTVPFADAPQPGVRYGYDNTYFGVGDALVWWSMLRLRRPRRVVEIGSGWSSAVLLDAVDATPGWEPELTFVEPHSERLRELLLDPDEVTLIEAPVQDAPRALFQRLEAGDVLFIDSTHVAKVGSDVNLLLLEVVPSLPAGVLVHVHDMLYPFEYPLKWVLDGRAWNEAYVMRALLIGNRTLRIVWWNTLMYLFHRDSVSAALPGWERNPGGSLYVETVAVRP